MTTLPAASLGDIRNDGSGIIPCPGPGSSGDDDDNPATATSKRSGVVEGQSDGILVGSYR